MHNYSVNSEGCLTSDENHSHLVDLDPIIGDNVCLEVRVDISSLKRGQQATIIAYDNADHQYRSKLLSLGLTLGTVIECVSIAPLGDPVTIRVRGNQFALRLDEAQCIKLQLSETP